MNTRPNVEKLAARPCPRSSTELEDAIKASGCIDAERPFERLLDAVQQTPSFLEKTLAFVWNEMLSAPEMLPEIPVLDGSGTVTLTQRQCLCILANAFFCTYPDRVSNNCESGTDIPSINLDELYGGRGWGYVEVAKLQMLFNYFEQCRARLDIADPLSRPVRFVRCRAEATSLSDWCSCEAPLAPPVVYPLERSLDEAKGMLQVDFANRIIGGAAIAYGCVQEEIMFCVCPELIVSRLFCPAMHHDEAIVFIGIERFSQSKGYQSSLEYAGPYVDRDTLRSDGALDSYVVAIDAIDLRSADFRQQYISEVVLRELNKAWAGFGVPNTPAHVATGNWGCGAFGGDPELKSVIQWLATSRAGKVMHYFPWHHKGMALGLPELVDLLSKHRVTVGQLSRFLLYELRPQKVFAQLRERFDE